MYNSPARDSFKSFPFPFLHINSLRKENMTFDFCCYVFFPPISLPSVSSRSLDYWLIGRRRDEQDARKAKLNFFLFARRFMLKSLRRSLKHSLIYSKNVFSYKITKPTKWKWRWKRASEETKRKKKKIVIGKPTTWLKMVIIFLSLANLFIVISFVFFSPHFILKCKIMPSLAINWSKNGNWL